MWKKTILLTIFLLNLFTNIQATHPINGKYCANIFGNTLNITLTDSYANVSGNIFGNQISCPWQEYRFNDTNILLNNNKSSCVNSNLEKNNACPCPPDMTYSKNDLIAHHTVLGNLVFKEC